MNTSRTNPTTASSRWVYFSRMIRGFLGVPLSAVLTAALLFVGIMAGCKEDEGTITGVFDNTPPLAVSMAPACGATGVALNQKFSVTFNEAMDASTVTAATFTLSGPSGSPVSGTVAYVSATYIATFTPASNLAPNTTYTWAIKGGANGAADQGGNVLANNFGCSFTTGAAPDVTPPTVVSTNPANNATGVPLNKVSNGSAGGPGVKLNKTTGTAAGKIITATFSEAMDPLTITSSTFTVTGPGVTPVVGFVTYAGPNFGASFIAATNLSPSTIYTGTITTGAKDLAGNALASNYVWSFTTGAVADITPPTVLFTDPANNATGVALNKKIAATFSEAMNASTLNATTFTLKQGTTSVLGSVTSAGTAVLFTPSSTLLANTVYTATISTGAKDTTGNALAGNYVWNFTTGAAPDVTPPTVILTDPAKDATGVALNKIITATFSEAMDPSTLGTATFTLRQGTTVIPGTLTYAGTTENFTPTSILTANTVYTATMSTGVKDLAGNALASNYVWSFTTAAAADLVPPTVVSTDPADNTSGVLLTKVITAIFSEGMNQSTITTATVTVTGLGGAPVTGTVNYASGANTVTFTPASTLAPNTTYTGKIKGGVGGAEDLAGNALALNYVWSFTTGAAIDATPPTVLSTDPVNAATGVAVNKKIAMNFSEAMNQSTLNASTFTLQTGSTSTGGAITFTGTTALFTPATSLTPNAVYIATISTGAKDLAGNALASNYVWTFTTGAAPDITPPTVIATDPANKATGVSLSKVNVKGSARSASLAAVNNASGAAAGKIITATFSEAMDPLTITSSTFTIAGPGVTPVTGLVGYVGTSFTATFITANILVPNTTYTGTITTGSKDLAGNALAINYVWTFTTGATPDVTPPTVIFTDPENGVTGVAINKKIAATFSEAMKLSTITSATFTLQQGTNSVPGAVAYAGTIAILTPASTLAANTTYTATITTGAKDSAGNGLASNYVWTFTTGDAPDIIPPVVISTDPANNATGVAINKKIAVEFSEVMDALTVTTATFTLTQGTTPILGTVTYAVMGATFAPSSTLAANAIYTATITTGAKDLAGNALVNTYVWTFTTGAAPDITPPIVLSTDPPDNARGVNLFRDITAVFNEAMDPLTISAANFTLTKAGGISVAGQVTYSGTTANFNPDFLLQANVNYTATITTGAKDLAGNALAQNYVWSFYAAGAATQYSVSLSSNPLAGGTTSGSGTFTAGASATVTATPNAGYMFTNWTEGVSIVSTNPTYSFTVFGNRTLVANFSVGQYTVALSSNPPAGGTTSGGGSFSSGASATLTATPNVGYTFTNWTEGVVIVSTNATYSFTVTSNRTLVANFSVAQYTVSLSSNPLAGGITGGGGLFNSGASVTVTATPSLGYTFTNWTEGLLIVSTNANYTFVISGNKTLVANFAVAGPPPIAAVDLLSTKNFVILAGAEISNVPLSDITGDLGLSPAAGSFYHGLTGPEVHGITYAVDANGPAFVIQDATRLTAAKGDLTIAYNDAKGRTPVPTGPNLNPGLIPGSGDIGGMVLAPGLYKFTVPAKITVNVTLTGGANDVWIFMCDQDLTVSNNAQVLLGGSAQSKNIFWQVGTSAALGTATIFEGTIMADQSITLATGATLHGRAFARIALVSLQQVIIVRPAL